MISKVVFVLKFKVVLVLELCLFVLIFVSYGCFNVVCG